MTRITLYLLLFFFFGSTKNIRARIPPSPSLSARSTRIKYFTLITSINAQKINEKAPVTSVKFYVTYKNKKTGEKKEFLTPNYPWNDSVWMSQWAFVGQRADDSNQGLALTLRIEDASGNDMTQTFIDNPDLQFIFVSYNLDETNKEAFRKILPFSKKAANDGYSFICLTNSFGADVKKFRMENGTLFDYYSADDVVLKTMVRANPGLILLKDGVVLAKWNYRDFPAYDEVKRKYLKQLIINN